MKTISEWVDIYNVDEETAAAIQRDALEAAAKECLETPPEYYAREEDAYGTLRKAAAAIRALMPKENERGDE